MCSSYAQTQSRPVSEYDQEVNQLLAQFDSRIIAGEIAKQVGFLDEMRSLGSPHKGRVDKLISQESSETHTSIYGVSYGQILALCTWKLKGHLLCITSDSQLNNANPAQSLKFPFHEENPCAEGVL